MEQSKETVFEQPPNRPLKKARLDLPRPWEDSAEEERWYMHMENVRLWHLTQAMYENAMNYLIEESGSMTPSTIEDEAVTMAIRSHGLTCGSEDFAYSVDRAHIETLLEYPTTSRAAYDSTSRDDILSQAITVAICKKGLGAIDR